MDEVNSILKLLNDQNAAAATTQQQLQLLETMAQRLMELKQKVQCYLRYHLSLIQCNTVTMPTQLDEANQAEEADALRCQARLQHLQQAGPPPKDGVISWNRGRLDRLLVDHMLHSGFYQTATCLTSDSHIQVSMLRGHQLDVSLSFAVCTFYL